VLLTRGNIKKGEKTSEVLVHL